MNILTTKMSSKGQIVIPNEIRLEFDMDEGTIFAVLGKKDTIILKKIHTPSPESLIRELGLIAKEGKQRLQQKGLQEQDLKR